LALTHSPNSHTLKRAKNNQKIIPDFQLKIGFLQQNIPKWVLFLVWTNIQIFGERPLSESSHKWNDKIDPPKRKWTREPTTVSSSFESKDEY
jgi:hypothetical protein